MNLEDRITICAASGRKGAAKKFAEAEGTVTEEAPAA